MSGYKPAVALFTGPPLVLYEMTFSYFITLFSKV